MLSILRIKQVKPPCFEYLGAPLPDNLYGFLGIFIMALFDKFAELKFNSSVDLIRAPLKTQNRHTKPPKYDSLSPPLHYGNF